MLWLMVGIALGAEDECRWEKIESVSSSMTRVTINGETIRVVGRPSYEPLKYDLQKCGWSGAASTLESWRGQRRATNWTAGIGLLVVWPVIIATPFTATAAGRWRRQLETDILEGR